MGRVCGGGKAGIGSDRYSNLMPARVTGPGRVKLDAGPEVDADTGALRAGEGCAAVVRPEKLKVTLPGAAVALPEALAVVSE